MGFEFKSSGERPEWMPEAGHYLLGVYHLGEALVDFKQGNGPEARAEWGFVVLDGSQAGKRIIETTSFSFFDGGTRGGTPATAYKWIKVLRFKGQPPPSDYKAESDDIVGRIASGTCAEDAKGWLHVSKDLLPVVKLPDHLTVEGIKAIMDQARADHAAVAAERGATTSDGRTHGFVDINAALASAQMVDADIPF